MIPCLVHKIEGEYPERDGGAEEEEEEKEGQGWGDSRRLIKLLNRPKSKVIKYVELTVYGPGHVWMS